MIHNDSIACGLPFRHFSQSEQTKFSIALRITAIALGVLALTIGILMLVGIPGWHQLGTIAGWTTFSIGTAAIFIGSAIKCVRHKEKTASSSIPSFSKTSVHAEKENQTVEENTHLKNVPLETCSDTFFDFESLPIELKLEILKFINPNFTNFSLSNKENYY